MRRESCFLIPVVSVEINPLFFCSFFYFLSKTSESFRSSKSIDFCAFFHVFKFMHEKAFPCCFFLVVLLVVKFFQMYVNGT